MSYSRIEGVAKSAKARGRKYQYIGDKQVTKYAFSPYTAKAGERYTFYADIVFETEIESPPGSGVKVHAMSAVASVGTFLDFRDAVASGEVDERMRAVAEQKHGVVKEVTYWRNRGERSDVA